MPEFNAALFNAALFGGSAASAGLTPRQVGQGLLYPALRKAQVTLGPQRTPSPAQFQDAIDELNRLAGSLNCDRLNIYSIARQELPLDPVKASYTIGLSPDPFIVADFPVERPQMIESANLLWGDGSTIELALLDALHWARRCRYQTDGISAALYNDRGYPISTLYFDPPPTSGCTLELFSWTQVPYFQTITDVVLLPMQYEDALVLNLAVRLAPHFQKDAVPPDVRRDAQLSLMRLQSINAPQPIADLSWGPGSWNHYDDYGAGPIVSGGTSGAAVPGPPGPPGPTGAAGPGAIGITIDGGGAPITTGLKGYLSAPFAGTITGWDVVADQAGSITIEVAKKAGGVPDAITDKISASSPVALAGAQIALNGSISGWTAAVAEDDVFGFNVTAAATITRLTVTIQIQKS